MSISTLTPILLIEPVVYVRKLNRRSDWGSSTDPLQERVDHAVQRVFESDPDSKYSLYRIENIQDLRRVAIGLNGNRRSLGENLDLISFTPGEWTSCGAVWAETAGETRCLSANRLHVDIEATKDQLTQLCQVAMESGRQPARLSKSIMREFAEELTVAGCYATTETPNRCQCESD